MKFDWKKLKPGKRTVVVAFVALLAIGAVWLNWNYQKTSEEAGAKTLAQEYEAVESRRILGENYASDTREASKQDSEEEKTALEALKAQLKDLKQIRYNYDLLERDVIDEKKTRSRSANMER